MVKSDLHLYIGDRMGSNISDKTMRKFYAGAVGIISRIEKSEYRSPVISRYGTFADFLKLSKKMYEDGIILKDAQTGEHDGKEKISGNTYDSWIEDWLWYDGKKSHYGIEFHTIRHSKYKDDVKVFKKFEKPTASNDTQFAPYRKALTKGKSMPIYSKPIAARNLDDFVRNPKR